MPEVTTDADGSQDALVVRVSAGGHVGWGECEAAPLPSIAAFVCPMSRGVCRPVAASVLGQRIDAPADIARRSEEHTSELQSLMRISYAVFCLKKKKTTLTKIHHTHNHTPPSNT